MSISWIAAQMTIAPSAAVGKCASTGRANSRTASADAAAVSEYSWVRLPAVTAMAVLLALLLTGNPRSRLDPALATPSASNSRLATICSPRRANDRAVSTTSLKPTNSTLNAGSSSSCRSCGRTPGSAGTGRLAGIGPTTPIPRLFRPNAATAAVASSKASSRPGICGHRHRTTRRKVRTDAATATVAGWTPPMPPANEMTSVKKVCPVTGTPVTRRS
jgi:hypothetical protein